MSIAHLAPGGKNVLLIFLVPGGTISPISHYTPGGKKCFINPFGPWRHHPINMRPHGVDFAIA